MATSDLPTVDALAALELFRGVPSEVLQEVIAWTRIRVLPRGASLFHQGEPAQRAHALLVGAVRISQVGSDGEQAVIRFIGAGEIFGSVPIYTDRRYPADAVAMIDSIEASWGQRELVGLMERRPAIAINMLTIVGRRLAELQDRVRELATQRADRRIANTLLRLARQAGHATAAGIEIGFPLRRKDIADISGTTLHTASRILSQWRKDRLIISDRRRLTLSSLAAIQQILGD